ncbi:hypothetical protein Naga_100006g79 [Nannochloropsis gaditana]|uniref:Uncharacterized protein n=1 Tax=Nannochloropsis gaditana TaxID=72520 RepID=W7U9G3_9STRA|nr:hypothetical protein Naga_100006g79 [Nannochloropsis gaditana]
MIRCRKYLSIPSPSAPSLRHISQRSMTTRTRAKANVGNDVTPAKEGVATRQRRQASDSSGPPSQTSLPPIKKAVKRTSNVDQSDDDDDKPVEIQSRAIRDGERGNHSRPSGLNTRVKKRPRKVKERENKYWAEKGGHEGAGQGRPVHEDEGDVQGLSAPNHAATEANEDGQKNVEEANRLVDPSSGDEPLPATFWEAVQRAKEAEQQQRINEALRRVETKRCV